MGYRIYIPSGDGSLYSFSLKPSQLIYVPNVLVMEIYKIHAHRYDLRAFFYADICIVPTRSYKSLKELYGAIQKLLQERLYVDVQKANTV